MSELSNQELDAAVCMLVELKPEGHPRWEQERTFSKGGWWQAIHVGAGLLEWHTAKSPSESTDAALRAYEEWQKQKGDRWRLFGLIHTVDYKWEAQIICHTDGVEFPVIFNEVADTPARAICLALISAAKREA